MTVEELYSELRFEFGNAAADRRLCHVHRRSRTGEAARTRDGHEVAEVLQIHRYKLSIRDIRIINLIYVFSPFIVF
jgi:hypothetical protein